MNVSKTNIHLDTSSFIHFDDKYFQTEGVDNIKLVDPSFLGMSSAGNLHVLVVRTIIFCLCIVNHVFLFNTSQSTSMVHA